MNFFSVKRNQEMTYISDPMVQENSFLTREQTSISLPEYTSIRHRLPQPIWPGHENVLKCYDKAWELCFAHIQNPVPGTDFVSPFIDAAFNGSIFLWDSCFMLMFGKYAHSIFNFQQTLDNFYSHQHKDGFICREIHEADSIERFARHDPSSTGPNILPWCEWESYLLTGDLDRIRQVFPPLVAYHRWLRENRTWPGGGYYSSGWGCGMDNQPRLPDSSTPEKQHFSHGHMVWVDICCQQLISCAVLLEMAKLLGRSAEAEDMAREKEQLTRLVNDQLWDPETGYYYDLWPDGRLNGVKSIAGYWALLTGIVPKDRQDAFVAHLENEKEFKRPHRVPSLSADNPEYRAVGEYWQGSVWAPTNYMVLSGLRTIGREALAHEIAVNSLDNVVEVFEKTGTLWENYAPESASQGNYANPEFVGWTGLVPITTLFEYVFGIELHADRREILWHIQLTDEFGVRQLPIGTLGTVDLHCKARTSESDVPEVTIRSDIDLKVTLCYGGQTQELSVPASASNS